MNFSEARPSCCVRKQTMSHQFTAGGFFACGREDARTEIVVMSDFDTLLGGSSRTVLVPQVCVLSLVFLNLVSLCRPQCFILYFILMCRALFVILWFLRDLFFFVHPLSEDVGC